MQIQSRRSLRAAACVMLAIAAAVAIAACGGSGSTSTGGGGSSKVTSDLGATPNTSRPANEIQVLVYGDSENSIEKWEVATYNKTAEGHKVKAVFESIPGANYQAKLQTIMSTSSAPDIFFNWGGGSIEQFQKAGLLLPLNQMMQQNPKLKSSFLPSILDAAKIDSDYYGIPMRGTQPVVLFYNKKLLARDHLKVPTTIAQLTSDCKTLKADGVKVPIADGGADQWPTQMWFEYFFDRVAGPSLVTKALAGDSSEWGSADAKKALSDIAKLVKSGAFGPSKSWDSVYDTKNQTAEMMVKGVSAFELQGSWQYSTYQDVSKSWVKSDLGWTTFPSVAGGLGNVADLAGNTENYYSVLKDTRYPQAVADFLKIMYTPAFVKKELAIGNLTTTTNTKSLISGATAPYLKWQYKLVDKAPAFQLSWDQAYPQTDTNTIHSAVAAYFDNLNQQQFIQSMEGLTPPGKSS